jgi:hypothetical protein
MISGVDIAPYVPELSRQLLIIGESMLRTLLVVILLGLPVLAQSTQEKRWPLRATADAVVTARPDRASISSSIIGKGKTLKKAVASKW